MKTIKSFLIELLRTTELLYLLFSAYFALIMYFVCLSCALEDRILPNSYLRCNVGPQENAH